MRSIHPRTVLGRSGWRTRAAGGIALAGVVAGVVNAAPARAHDGDHYVMVSGWIQLRQGEYQPPIVCDHTFAETKTLKRTASSVSFKFDRNCDGNQVRSSLTMTVTKNDRGAVDVKGNVRYDTEACLFNWLLCITTHKADYGFHMSLLGEPSSLALRPRATVDGTDEDGPLYYNVVVVYEPKGA